MFVLGEGLNDNEHLKGTHALIIEMKLETNGFNTNILASAEPIQTNSVNAKYGITEASVPRGNYLSVYMKDHQFCRIYGGKYSQSESLITF